jgi:hypothetical protein
MTKFEAVKFMESHDFCVRLEFDSAQIDDWKPMKVSEFIAYVTGFEEGMHWGYEGIPP